MSEPWNDEIVGPWTSDEDLREKFSDEEIQVRIDRYRDFVKEFSTKPTQETANKFTRTFGEEVSIEELNKRVWRSLKSLINMVNITIRCEKELSRRRTIQVVEEKLCE